MKKIHFFLLAIIALALFLRLFRLGEYPATLYGDEQAFAYNAYSILQDGRDEYGIKYPLQFRSFNDYKAPIPVYFLVPVIKFFGLNAFAVRMPIAIASSAIVVITYLLACLYFPKKIALTSAFLTAVSPWLLHLSRGYFEATLALLFFLAGIYFVLKSKLKLRPLLIGMLFFEASIYSYFTPRILLPIFIPFLLLFVCLDNNEVKKKAMIKNLFVGILVLFLVSLPLLKATFFDKGFSRFDKLTGDTNQVVIQTVNRERSTSTLDSYWRQRLHNKATVWARFVTNNYLEHLSANFWYIYGDNSLRYFLGNMGMFHLFELPFFIIGMYEMWKKKRNAAIFFSGWILLAPIPASIVGRSFAVRSLAMLPAPFMFVSYGMYSFFSRFKNQFLNRSVLALLGIIVAVSLGFVLVRYYFEYPVYAATWWGYENKAAIDFAKQREDKFDQIFISDFYTGAPLAYAVYSQVNPQEYREAVNNPVTLADNRHFIKIGKYYFGSLDIDKKRFEQHVLPPRSLYIGRPEEFESDLKIVAPDDGRILFKIFETP